MRENWTQENNTPGQCYDTAFLLQDLYGGRVYGAPLSDGSFHCFNAVGGCTFDLTDGAPRCEITYEYAVLKKRRKSENEGF